MKNISKIIAIAALAGVSGVSYGASSVELKELVKLTNEVCESVPKKGSSQSIDISGEASAKLNGIAKKLANLGVEGNGKYSAEEYQGVLQKDLADLVKSSNDCRKEVLKHLSSLVSQNSVSVPPEPSEDNYDNGWLGTINVNTSLTTNDGKPWDKPGFLDKKGAPDIGICITYSNSQRYCDPFDGILGNYGWGNIAKMKCRNSYRCAFEDVVFLTKGFSIEVFDVDQNGVTVIAQGNCVLGEDCAIGKVNVASKLVEPYYQ